LIEFDVKAQQGMDFFTGGSIIMDYGLIFWLEALDLDFTSCQSKG